MNRERFEQLYLGIGELVRGHLAGGELELEKVYEALSALWVGAFDRLKPGLA